MNLCEFIEKFGFNPVTEWDLPPYAEGFDFACSISGGEWLCSLYAHKGCVVDGVNISGTFNGTFSVERSAPYIAAQTKKRWKEGRFIKRHMPNNGIPPHKEADLLPYEEYMKALPMCKEWETGSVFVFFPPEGSENNELHTHPISDRIITVVQGSGWFICVRESRLVKYALERGTRVWMPRGKLHTFFASPEGLVVESIHNPYVPVGHPKCLYSPPKDKIYYDLSLAEEIILPEPHWAKVLSGHIYNR